LSWAVIIHLLLKVITRSKSMALNIYVCALDN
jgi:hypothetical protein